MALLPKSGMTRFKALVVYESEILLSIRLLEESIWVLMVYLKGLCLVSYQVSERGVPGVWAETKGVLPCDTGSVVCV